MTTAQVIEKALSINVAGGNTDILEELMEENIELVIQEDRFFELPNSMVIRILKNTPIELSDKSILLIINKAKSKSENYDDILKILKIKTIEDKVKYMYGNDRLASNILRANKKLQVENKSLQKEIENLKNEVATLKAAQTTQSCHARSRTPVTKSVNPASKKSAHSPATEKMCYSSRIPKSAVHSEITAKVAPAAPKNTSLLTVRNSKSKASPSKAKK